VGRLGGIRLPPRLQITESSLLLIPLPRVALAARRWNIDQQPDMLRVQRRSCGVIEVGYTTSPCLLLVRRLESQKWRSAVLISEGSLLHSHLSDNEIDTSYTEH
jgi:hypothetical protein